MTLPKEKQDILETVVNDLMVAYQPIYNLWNDTI